MGVYVFTEIAKHVGLPECMIFSQIHYWCEKNRRSGKNLQDGYFWCRRTVREFVEKDFDWASDRSLSRYLNKLEKLGVLVSTKLRTGRVDNTKAYRANFERVFELYGVRLGEVKSNVPEVVKNVDFDDNKLLTTRIENKVSDKYINLLKRLNLNESELAANNMIEELKVLHVIKRFFKENSSVIVNSRDVCFEEMEKVIDRLTTEHIYYVADRLKEAKGEIWDVYKYTMPVLYDAELQMDTYYERKVKLSMDNNEELDYFEKDDWLQKT